MIVEFEESGLEETQRICWLILAPETTMEALDVGILYHLLMKKGMVCRREGAVVKFSMHICLPGAERKG